MTSLGRRTRLREASVLLIYAGIALPTGVVAHLELGPGGLLLSLLAGLLLVAAGVAGSRSRLAP